MAEHALNQINPCEELTLCTQKYWLFGRGMHKSKQSLHQLVWELNLAPD